MCPGIAELYSQADKTTLMATAATHRYIIIHVPHHQRSLLAHISQLCHEEVVFDGEPDIGFKHTVAAEIRVKCEKTYITVRD
jgi:hypothetical protein